MGAKGLNAVTPLTLRVTRDREAFTRLDAFDPAAVHWPVTRLARLADTSWKTANQWKTTRKKALDKTS